MLDVLAAAQPADRIPTQVIAALLDARLLDESDVDEALGVLAAKGIIPPALLARARADADSTVVENARQYIRPVDGEY